MKHLILKYYPSLSTSVSAILAVLAGGLCYKYNALLTDFEIIIITICAFIMLKGIITFTKYIIEL